MFAAAAAAAAAAASIHSWHDARARAGRGQQASSRPTGQCNCLRTCGAQVDWPLLFPFFCSLLARSPARPLARSPARRNQLGLIARSARLRSACLRNYKLRADAQSRLILHAQARRLADQLNAQLGHCAAGQPLAAGLDRWPAGRPLARRPAQTGAHFSANIYPLGRTICSRCLCSDGPKRSRRNPRGGHINLASLSLSLSEPASCSCFRSSSRHGHLFRPRQARSAALAAVFGRLKGGGGANSLLARAAASSIYCIAAHLGRGQRDRARRAQRQINCARLAQVDKFD